MRSADELRRQLDAVEQDIVTLSVRICEIEDDLGLARRERNRALNARANIREELENARDREAK